LENSTASSVKAETERSLDGAKEAVAEKAERVPGERAGDDSVRISAFRRMADIPELIEVPRLGKSLYGTNLGRVSQENYI